MTSLILTGILLVSIQTVVAIPWLLALLGRTIKQVPSRGFVFLGGLVGFALVGGAGLGFAMDMLTKETLDTWGKLYAMIFQAQLFVDFFVIVFFLLFKLWPKGAAVARAAFREGYRQPMFWLIWGGGLLFLVISPFIPYFTFGEDYLMVQELGYDVIILAATIFGVIAASMSISEEIEGRTAVTLMSKPVSRRQFLIGKFVGIFMTCMILILFFGVVFEGMLLYKRWFDAMDPVQIPADVQGWVTTTFSQSASRDFANGMVMWGYYVSEVLPGLVKAGALVMILVSLSVMMATRFPMIINLVTCLVIYFLANLMPILVDLTGSGQLSSTGTVQQLLHFVAQLFDAILPGLEVLRVNPTLVGVNAVSFGEYVWHVLSAGFYGILYTAVVLIIGLILFEDRDLA